MRAGNISGWLMLLAIFCIGCGRSKNAPPSQAQAPPLQTGQGKLSPPAASKPQEASSPLASPLPPPSAQNVPLPPPPPPKKVRHRVKSAPKPAENPPAQTAPQATAQATPPAEAEHEGTASPIGQLTTGDSATGEKTKRETADLIAETQQGLAGIKRSLSTDEMVTAAQIRTFVKQAEQAMDNGDMDGAHTLATKAKLLLDELIKP